MLFGYRGSSKRMVEGRGLVKSYGSYFVHFFKYLTRYVPQICYIDENHHFLTCFYDFLAKIFFLLIFMYIFNAVKFLRVHWLYDVTVTSWSLMVLNLVSMDRGGLYLYTVASIGVSGILYRKSRERVTATPLWRTCYKIYLRRTRVDKQANRQT